jgi:hypothetical protein
LIESIGGGQLLHRPSPKLLNLPGQRGGGFGQTMLLGRRIRFPRGAQQRIAAVLNFAGDDLPGEAEQSWSAIRGCLMF